MVVLKVKDNFGCILLYYVVQFGFVVVCQILMKKMQDWGMFDVENGIDVFEWQDKNGEVFLYFSVFGGYVFMIKVLF